MLAWPYDGFELLKATCGRCYAGLRAWQEARTGFLRQERLMFEQRTNRPPFGFRFFAGDEAELSVVLATESIPEGSSCRLVATTNVSHVVELSRNEQFRDAYRDAWITTVDGTPVLLYSMLRGHSARVRLTGSGLFAKLMPLLSPERHRVFFLAPSETVAEFCRAYLIDRGFQEGSVVTFVPPKGFETSDSVSLEIVERIATNATTHLILGVGAPKSEIWVHQHRVALGPCYALCVGAGLEFFAGVKSRGPAWMQRVGLEWFWRFMTEPRRLFRRYFVDSWIFLKCVAYDVAGRPLLEQRQLRGGMLAQSSSALRAQ